ncbi:MAG: hypothetical protein PWQ22_1340 [Archaeoglobaceae archaeon]|nr:hypothetical protein [Archaeoglobaceae archaeon]
MVKTMSFLGEVFCKDYEGGVRKLETKLKGSVKIISEVFRILILALGDLV